MTDYIDQACDEVIGTYLEILHEAEADSPQLEGLQYNLLSGSVELAGEAACEAYDDGLRGDALLKATLSAGFEWLHARHQEASVDHPDANLLIVDQALKLLVDQLSH